MDFESIEPSYFYNPYSLPYVAFFNEPHPNISSFPFRDNFTYEDINIITSIDASPPIQSPEISLSIHIPTGALLICAVFFIQFRTLQMLKLEKGVNNRMMVTQAKLQMTFWPSCIVMYALADIIYPLSALLSSYFCKLKFNPML